MEEVLMAQTTNKMDIAKFATFIIIITFILGRFYGLTYLYSIGLDSRKIDLTLLDYMTTGLDLIPVTILLIANALFSIKPKQTAKIAKNNITVKKFNFAFFINKLCSYWIPMIFMCAVFLLYSYSILKSVIFLILIFITPFIAYYTQKKKIEKILTTKISNFSSLIVKFTLILIILFTIIGFIDGNADKSHLKHKHHLVSLRNPNTITQQTNLNNGKLYTFEGYTLRTFDKITIFDVNGQLVVINNWEILSIEKNVILK